MYKKGHIMELTHPYSGSKNNNRRKQELNVINQHNIVKTQDLYLAASPDFFEEVFKLTSSAQVLFLEMYKSVAARTGIMHYRTPWYNSKKSPQSSTAYKVFFRHKAAIEKAGIMTTLNKYQLEDLHLENSLGLFFFQINPKLVQLRTLDNSEAVHRFNESYKY